MSYLGAVHVGPCLFTLPHTTPGLSFCVSSAGSEAHGDPLTPSPEKHRRPSRETTGLVTEAFFLRLNNEILHVPVPVNGRLPLPTPSQQRSQRPQTPTPVSPSTVQLGLKVFIFSTPPPPRFELRASHIAGTDNRIPDHLSRWHLSDTHRQQFELLTRDVNTVEIPISRDDFELDWRYSRRLPVHVYRHRRDLRRLRGQNTKLPKAPRRPRDHGLRGDAHRTRDIDHRRDLRRLRGQASRTKWAAFAEGTWSNLRTILRTYLLFCFFYWISPFPATVDTLETFAEFLARSFKAPASIANYLGGLKSLHVLFGYTVDAFLSTDIALLKRGLQRRLCHTPRQVAPFTPDILLRIYEHLDLMDPFHATMGP
uniref:Core-binding (CB) domain-containing protein n=1 Tax=Branchiostoma floridae TaxID=7739 RepID=C3Z6G5_BRAFL|eukprot:XP_002595797.1 hypothetical protein BRAFLDRAFT_128087 [Branchiostoma floridae]